MNEYCIKLNHLYHPVIGSFNIEKDKCYIIYDLPKTLLILNLGNFEIYYINFTYLSFFYIFCYFIIFYYLIIFYSLFYFLFNLLFIFFFCAFNYQISSSGFRYLLFLRSRGFYCILFSSLSICLGLRSVIG